MIPDSRPSEQHHPAGQISLPEPSILPAVCAVGIAITLLGLVSSLVIFIIGALITVGSLLGWISKALPPADGASG